MKAGSKQIGERQRARQSILDAAARLFAERGYHTTTMAMIAKQAGFSASSIYYYFDSKEAIFQGINQSMGRGITEAITSILADRRPFIVRFEALAIELLRQTEAGRDYFIFFLTQRPFFEWSLKEELGEDGLRLYEHNQTLMTVFFQQGIDEGVLRPIDPAALAVAYGGIFRSYIFEWCRSGAMDSLTEKAEFIVSMFLNGVARNPERSSVGDAVTTKE